jgi:hypothetical protein
MIDIEHLHAVIEGTIKGRRSGQTLAMCMQIIGHIQVGKINQIAIGLAHMRHMHDFQKQLAPLLEENGIWMCKERKAGMTEVWRVGTWVNPDGAFDHEPNVQVRFVELHFTPVINRPDWESGRETKYIYMQDHYATAAM